MVILYSKNQSYFPNSLIWWWISAIKNQTRTKTWRVFKCSNLDSPIHIFLKFYLQMFSSFIMWVILHLKSESRTRFITCLAFWWRKILLKITSFCCFLQVLRSLCIQSKKFSTVFHKWSLCQVTTVLPDTQFHSKYTLLIFHP